MNEPYHTETREGFDIKLFIEHEDICPSDLFDSECHNINEIIEKIESGEYVWFRAVVEAHKKDIKLGSAALGGNLCDYRALKNFPTDGYYEDLVNEAISDAKHAIKDINS